MSVPHVRFTILNIFGYIFPLSMASWTQKPIPLSSPWIDIEYCTKSSVRNSPTIPLGEWFPCCPRRNQHCWWSPYDRRKYYSHWRFRKRQYPVYARHLLTCSRDYADLGNVYNPSLWLLVHNRCWRKNEIYWVFPVVTRLSSSIRLKSEYCRNAVLHVRKFIDCQVI